MRLIDADALKEEFNKKKVVGRFNTIVLIDNAPTVDVTDYDTGYQDGLEAGLNDIRPKGEWKYTTHYARRYRVCPFCTAEKEDDRSAGWNFCWYCGADMRKENKFNDLVVFDDQPKRQLENPDCHNEL